MSRQVLDLSISKPCQQRLSATPDSPHLYCDLCKKQVHDFAKLRPKQIQELIAFSSDEICGRVTRRADGSLLTLEEPERAHFASLVAVVPLGLSVIASAQSAVPTQAIVSGKIQRPDNFPDIGKFAITLSQNGEVKSSFLAESAGKWKLAVPPGNYDLSVRALVFSSAELDVKNIALHPGEQSFESMHLRDRSNEQTVTEGEIVLRSSFLRNTAYRLRHPIRYIAYLRRRYL